MTSKTKPTDPYTKAGVNIEKGNELIQSIKASGNATHDKESSEELEVLRVFFNLDPSIKILFW